MDNQMDGAGGASREGNAHSDDSSRGAGGGAGNLGGSSWAVRGTSFKWYRRIINYICFRI